MTIFYLVLAVVGCLIVARQILLLFSAEMGRKQDLIKHIYKSGTDFQIAVIVPYLDSRKIGPLQELIGALERQDYPQNRMEIHIAATEDTSFGLPNTEDMPPNTKVWTYPARTAKQGEIVSWLVERLLAAGGPSKLFVFLDADDIVRPDFMRNVTTRAFDCFAMQGYTALKRPPKGFIPYISALSTRFINRIENAGRFHLGLSCRLQNSGWVVRQEILEMIPFHQGNDTDNLEYTVLLNLNGYKVNWAPNVVIYKEEKVTFFQLMKDTAHSFLNRIRLTLRYGIPLIFQGIGRLDFNLFEQAWSIVKPPNFVIGLIGVIGAALLYIDPFMPGNFYYWSIFVLAFWSVQLLSLAVARCSFKDVLSFIYITPIAYATGLVMFPFFLLSAIGESFFNINPSTRRTRIGMRFDETQDPLKSGTLEKRRRPARKSERLLPFADARLDDEFEEDESVYSPITTPSATASSSRRVRSDDFETVYAEQFNHSRETAYAPQVSRETVRLEQREKPASRYMDRPQKTYKKSILPITNGKNSVNCLIYTHTDIDESGTEQYHLVFEYKNLTFTTQKYRILDQAFYELQTKLQSKGFTIVSCGNCAYFYRPTAGNAYGVAKDTGFCLSGKLGKEINLDTDAVTVVSEACHNFTSIEYRQAVMKQWQESMEQVIVS